MVAYIVEYTDTDTVHRLSGADTSVESATERKLGFLIGVSLGGESLCRRRVHGVAGFMVGSADAIPGLCAECEATYTGQRREVMPDGWDESDLVNYWVGFDRGRAFADFMERYRADAFGDEGIPTPHGVYMGDRSGDIFNEGVEDGVRSYVIADWSPRW